MSTVTETNPYQPFPEHQVFSFIPQLYESITKLRVYKEATQSQTQEAAAGGANTSGTGVTQSSSSRAPTSSPVLTRDATLTKTISKDSTVSNSIENLPPLEVKDLPEKVYEVKQAIQTAREVVKSLPDMDRSIADQETEIAELESLLLGLRKRLVTLGNISAGNPEGKSGRRTSVKIEDVAMQGVE